MFVFEEQVLSVGLGAARARLANLVHDGSLAGAAEAAYRGGADLLLQAGSSRGMPALPRRALVQFLDPVDHGDAVTLGMRWAADVLTDGMFPVLDADIKLGAEGEQYTRLTLTGVYRPPPGAVGAGLDRKLLRRIAAATVGSLMTHLAQGLAGAAPAAAEARPPMWRESGSEPVS